MLSEFLIPISREVRIAIALEPFGVIWTKSESQVTCLLQVPDEIQDGFSVFFSGI
jgi:hypothetical protein